MKSWKEKGLLNAQNEQLSNSVEDEIFFFQWLFSINITDRKKKIGLNI